MSQFSEGAIQKGLYQILLDREQHGAAWPKLCYQEVCELTKSQMGESERVAETEAKAVSDKHGMAGLEETLLWLRLLKNASGDI